MVTAYPPQQIHKFAFFNGQELQFFTEYNTGMAVFAMSDLGPEVLFQDISALGLVPDLSQDKIHEHLLRTSINSIVTLGQGHDYNVGVFDLPTTLISGFRIMLISFRLSNPVAKDPRLKKGYYQIALFVPKTLLQFLPAYVFFEKELVDLTTSLTSSGQFHAKKFKLLKTEILRTLNSYCRSPESIY
ncbi:MAG: hypothetical protein D6732_06565 [Methanobacteriota archaeon]|nr:MAG: hypothetical protein D6732_06565 [Euryarchaeota archaeon]